MSTSSNINDKAKWTADLRKMLIDICIEIKAEGGFCDSGFKAEQWHKIVNRFKELTGVTFAPQQLQSQYSDLKKKYGIFKSLVENSGFGFDDATQMPTTDENTWKEYITAHPGAAAYRKKPLENYELLVSLFEGQIATGSYANSPFQMHNANLKRDRYSFYLCLSFHS
jgi:hypothetical protein